MTLKLNLNGSADPFINYLKSYLRIRESLLLEIDTNLRAFVAKTFTEDKSSIRFSSISFDDANVSIISDNGEDERNGSRIKVGILIQLKKFIQIVERLGSDVNEKGESNFNIEIDYEPFQNTNDKSVDFVTTSISFSSEILKMRMDGFRISELTYLSDDTFKNVVFNATDAVSIEISASTINSIIKTSDIVKIDVRKDALVFYNEDKILYVKDRGVGSDKKSNFVYKIGELDTEPLYPINIPVTRDRFLKMLDKTDDDFRIIIGKSAVGDGNDVDRVLFDSTKSATKIVIAAMQDR
jgi:hypothetical protein